MQNNNPFRVRKDDNCHGCGKWYPVGTLTWGYNPNPEEKNKWYTRECAENLGIVCPVCDTKKDPKYKLCWKCMKKEMNRIPVDSADAREQRKKYENEYEEEAAKLEIPKEEEQEKVEEYYIKSVFNIRKNVYKTCTSINCPERKSLCCGALSTPTKDGFVCSRCLRDYRGGKCTAGEENPEPEFNPKEDIKKQLTTLMNEYDGDTLEEIQEFLFDLYTEISLYIKA